MPGVGRGMNPASHVNLLPRKKKEQDENNETPQYGVLPSSINAVSCQPMSAFLLHRILGLGLPYYSAMDGSGELCI